MDSQGNGQSLTSPATTVANGIQVTIVTNLHIAPQKLLPQAIALSVVLQSVALLVPRQSRHIPFPSEIGFSVIAAN